MTKIGPVAGSRDPSQPRGDSQQKQATPSEMRTGLMALMEPTAGTAREGGAVAKALNLTPPPTPSAPIPPRDPARVPPQSAVPHNRGNCTSPSRVAGTGSRMVRGWAYRAGRCPLGGLVCRQYNATGLLAAWALRISGWIGTSERGSLFANGATNRASSESR